MRGTRPGTCQAIQHAVMVLLVVSKVKLQPDLVAAWNCLAVLHSTGEQLVSTACGQRCYDQSCKHGAIL